MTNAQTPPDAPPSILVLGAYGLIGCGIARDLGQRGHNVIGFGRNRQTAHRVLPDIQWRFGDLRDLQTAQDWANHLDGITTVVNCSGALQDGPDDDLETVHHHAIAALARACAQADVQLVQISAVGAAMDADTTFLASKARGDASIRSSGCRYHILRPGLVIAPTGYGGTMLLRMLAAVPLIQPIALPDAAVQTVSLSDVARVTAAAVDGALPDGTELDLVEADHHSLRDLTAAFRSWLGFRPARRVIAFPAALTAATAALADALAWFGWRSPLRSTAINVLKNGVTAPPPDLAPFGLPPIAPLATTLSSMPARAEDRLSARVALLIPIIIATLVLFWLVSGVIGLLRAPTAALVLQNEGWPTALSLASVILWALVDIAVAGLFAWRRSAPHACWLAIAVSLFYLAASTWFVPHLWADPLGPLVKILPSITLALVARAALETR